MSNKLGNVLTKALVAVFLLGYVFADYLGWTTAIGLLLLSSLGIGLVRFLVEKRCRERLFEPLEERKLPRVFRKYVQQITPELERLGFDLIGDFLIYPEPASMRSRSFLSADGRCFAYAASKDDVCFFGFFSVLEDGCYFESSPLKPSGKSPAPEAPIEVAFHPNAAPDDLLRHHYDGLAGLESQRQTRAMTFTAAQYQEVSEYGFRLADWDLYQQGHRWTPPKSARPASAIGAPESATREPELVAASDGWNH